MGAASYCQSSFLGGEWSKTMQGRIDRQDYRTAMNKCLNGLPTDTGSWVRRPGEALIWPTREGLPARIVPFHFKNANSYVMEFTPSILRMYAGTRVAEHSPNFVVSAVSTASPARVTLTTPQILFAGGAKFDCFFTNLGTSCPLLQRRLFRATYVSTTQFTIQDGVTLANIDGSVLGTLPSGVVCHFVYALNTPFTGSAWSRVRAVQAETKAVLLEAATVPQVLEAVYPPTATTDAAFTIGEVPFVDGPYLSPVAGSLVTPSAVNGLVSLTLSFQAYDSARAYNIGDLVNAGGVNYKSLVNFNVGNTPVSSPSFWTGVNGGAAVGPNGFQSSDIGRHIRMFSEPALWNSGTTYAAKDVVAYNGAYWISLTNSNVNIIPNSSAHDWTPFVGAAAAKWTWGKVATVSGLGLISPALSGVANIGNMSGNGGLAAAFDGTLNKTAGASASAPCEDVSPPAWVPGTIYAAGLLAFYGGQNWVASAPATATWTTTPYNFADVVTYGGQYWVCIGAPALWNSTVVYPPGAFVSFNGSWYTSRTVATGATPPDISPGQWKPGVVPGLPGTESFWTQGVAPSTNASYWTAHALAATPYVGQNFTTPGAQTIAQAAVFPSTDLRFANNNAHTIRVSLYASNSAPSGPANGTLLGVTVSSNNVGSISISSSDTTTTWKFVWVVIQATQNDAGQQPATTYISQVQFYSPNVNNGTVITVQVQGDALLYTTTIRTWRLGVYSNTTGWPSCGTYHRGRLWLGGVVANRVDASNAGDASALFNFAPTGPDGTVSEANAITATFAADDVNPMFWMVSDLQGVICGTQGGEFLVFAPTQGSLAQLNVAADRMTKIGCANIEPKKTGLTLTFVQTHQRKLMEYFSDVISGKFASPNLSLTAKHLMKRRLAELAYQSESTPVVWARCVDGSLLGCTYKRESLLTAQGPAFSGWHQHALGSSHLIESICTGPSVDGTLDTLMMVTNDPVANVRYVGYLTDFIEEDSTAADAQQLDHSLAPAAMGDVTIGDILYLQITGFWYLAGKSVSIYAGGLDLGDVTVAADGTINLRYDVIPLFSQAFVASFAPGTIPIGVGYTFTSDGQMVRPATMAESGARNGPALGKKRRTQQIAALMNSTQAISFGTRFEKMYPALFRNEGGVTALNINELWNGVYSNANLQDDYGYDSMICWRITRPYPAIIAAIEGFLETQDK